MAPSLILKKIWRPQAIQRLVQIVAKVSFNPENAFPDPHLHSIASLFE